LIDRSSSCLLQVSSSPPLLSFCSTFCQLGTMCFRAFEAVVNCFDGSLSNTRFSCLIIISHHHLQLLPPLSPRLKPPEADSVDLTTSIVNQSLVSIKNPVCNAYLFNFLVSHAPFCIICHPLTYLQRYSHRATFNLARSSVYI